MEFFNKAEAIIRLKSHLNKYLVASDDGESVRQSRNGSSRAARWLVEFVDGRSHVIRLRSCCGRNLVATDEPFLLGMTGRKVLQTSPGEHPSTWLEWEPIKQGMLKVKLRTRGGKFLRANGGTLPWRNSITHDVPQRNTTQHWILWEVEMVELEEFHDLAMLKKSVRISPASSVSSVVEDFEALDGLPEPYTTRRRGMELFKNAKAVRLRSHRERYLLADEDGESVSQERSGSSRRSKWTVEFVESSICVLRFKSCYGKFLTATDIPFLLGVTGKKVLQTMPRKLDSSVEWEPIREGFQVRLKTRYGNFLRANGGLPPWRNSITHDIPHRTSSQDWVLWDVEIVEAIPKDPEPSTAPASLSDSSVPDSDMPSLISIKTPKMPIKPPKLSKLESSDSFAGSPMKDPGRDICYSVSDGEGGAVSDRNAAEESMFNFKGNGVEDLKQKLEQETGLDNIIVCSRNPLNGKLYPLRLALPPNHTMMHVVVIPASSKAAGEIQMPQSPPAT